MLSTLEKICFVLVTTSTWLCSTWKEKLNCMLDNDPLFKASCTFNGMVLLDGLEKWTLFAMILEMDMNVNADYRWRCKTLILVVIPTVTDYCRVPVKRIMLPCLSLLDAHLQLYLTSKKMVDQSLRELRLPGALLGFCDATPSFGLVGHRVLGRRGR